MVNKQVSILLRVSLGGGKQTFLLPLVAPNGHIKPQWGVYKGNPTLYPHGIYYLRFKQGGKIVFERIGPHLDEALAAQVRKAHILTGVTLGIEAPVVKRGHSLVEAINQHVTQAQAVRTKPTAKSYRQHLDHYCAFMASRGKTTVESIERSDMTAYVTQLAGEGLSRRTQHGYLTVIWPVLKAHGCEGIYPRRSWPKFEEREPEIYTHAEIDRLFEVATAEDRFLYKFFLCTGLRDKETVNATWANVLWDRKVYKVSNTAGFISKSKRERRIPLPDDLLDELQVR